MMDENQFKFFKVLTEEGLDCLDRGDKENGMALIGMLFDKLQPDLVEDTKKHPEIIDKLISQTNSKHEHIALSANIMLQYLKNKGVKLK